MVVLKYVIAIIVLSIVILFHELGHFWLAKANGIRVNEFSLGLGPTLVGFTRGETKYSIKLLPFGGACMMEGEDEQSDDDRSFQKKSVWARISVVAAGPVFNFIMAFILSVIVVGMTGYVKPVISGITDNSPAQEAGLAVGDEIVKLNRKPIHFYSEISMYVMFHQNETIDVTYLRDGKKNVVSIKPEYNEEYGRYLFGFNTGGEIVRTGPFQTLQYGVYNVKYWIQYTFGSLKMLVTRQVSLNDMSGPVGIVKVIGDSYQQSTESGGIKGGVVTMLDFGILLAANLGVINLLPLPALDGGRLLFLIIEAIRRKRVSPDREAMVHFIGIICLFGFMILIMANDVAKIFISS